MRYVVLGSSAAGINGIRSIRSIDKDGEITLISKDREVYSRCILHHYMEGIRSLRELDFTEPDFMKIHRVYWIQGQAVTGIDSGEREVLCEDGRKVPYDRLLIATGSHSFFPPVPGLKESGNVFGFRNFDDIQQILAAAERASHIVVMGAGLVGIDCVSGLLDLGKDMALIDMQDHMLSMQLDVQAAKAYEEAFAKKGLKQYYSTGIKAVQSDAHGNVSGVVLSDGTQLPCDLLVVTAGVRPNIDFLEGSGIAVDERGLAIDVEGRTNVEGVFGAGDVTGRNPIWPVAVKEGIIAGSNMAGKHKLMTDFFASKSTMNFLGIATMSLGIHTPPDETYRVERALDEERGIYKKVIHKDGKIYGAILQGDFAYSGILTQLIRRNVDVSKVKKPLFQIDYSDFFHMDENYEFYFED